MNNIINIDRIEMAEDVVKRGSGLSMLIYDDTWG